MPEPRTQTEPSQEDNQAERRVLAAEEIELRLDEGDAPRLTGYAAKFGKWSEDLGGFREKIRAGAFDDVLEDDVRCLKNHDSNLILGRTTSGTLRLGTNTVGLQFECDLPDTSTGRDTREEIRRKDITGCSFAFTVTEDDWRYLEDGQVERTIIKVGRLFDVGPVTYPAYPDTTVAARSLEKFQAERADPGPDGEPGGAAAAEPRYVDEVKMKQIQRQRDRRLLPLLAWLSSSEDGDAAGPTPGETVT